MPSSGLYNIEKLSSDNYHTWSLKAKMLLIKQKLWPVVVLPQSSGYTQPSDEDLDKHQSDERDQEALATIVLTVSDSQLSHISASVNARRAWYALQQAHERSGLTSKIFLKQKLFTKKKEPTEKVQTHINEMTVIRDRLIAIGSPTSDEDFAFLLLLSCCYESGQYGDLLTAISARDGVLSVSYVVSQLLQAEQQKEKTTGIPESVALVATRRTYRDIECYYCHEKGHTRHHCQKKLEADARKEENVMVGMAIAL